MLDPQKLDVYNLALQLLDVVDHIIDAWMGRAHLKDQLDRASTSILLNIAEGAGEFSADEKQRFYRYARRSATEVFAIVDLLERRKHISDEHRGQMLYLLDRIVRCLVGLGKG